ncbi:MAG: peptide ABC transporter ATP-binding protein [Curvibacter sp. RIFCSPHIGHO2_12_FULL_63_18]|uniref:DMT family transporter n=1 Tax=Rhodoferax sp. TaxID=50421 RepID=UPI0008B93421|nr:DMT family transporter [Rhodoferax sp.]OGO96748.1 MAG: peptide ABC transporter ATP-binding protein [Curvibacter sp. GWA2_63_95]OGP00926.1 MAG: peptide ABC transporter ATP-binding protein [Curvibacter sp. RIFCSPHIGHO2_12_FULL_63_18]HCX80493.1 EamA family transporter [Rhodoferax sp.]
MSSSPHPQAVSTFTSLTPLLFVALWSTGFIGAKFGLPDAGPLTFLSLRYAIVLVLMGALAWATRAPWPRTVQEWLHIGVSGLLVHAVYLGGVFIAIGKGLPAGVTALVVGLQPVLTALGAGVFLGERVRPAQWLGLALGFVGVGLVVAHKVVTGASGGALLGMLLPVVVALLAITAGTLYQKRYCHAFDLRSGSVIQFLPSLLATLLVASQTETLQIHWTGSFVFALAWLVLVLSLGAVSLLNVLIRSGSAVNVASLFYLVPPCTALIAWALFGETLTGLALLGMALTVFGVWLARK